MRSPLAAQYYIFTKQNSRGPAATTAPYQVSHILAKHKKPFKDGEMEKKIFFWKAADLLIGDFKNKTEIMAAVKDIQLSHSNKAMSGHGH